MKKRFFLLLISIILLTSFTLAANETSETQQIQDAYNCLTTTINDRGCSSLSFEDKLFSFLATGNCKTDLLADSNKNQCWPKAECTIKATSQAIYALTERGGTSTSEAEAWLSTRNSTASNIDWYLQIEGLEETQCTIAYGDRTYTININENKKINTGAGTCLTLAQDDYWLAISQNCHDTEFTISCDKSFSTSKVFKERGSSIIYVSPEIQSESSNGETKESVSSMCFTDSSGKCDYEGTLWAAIALKNLNYDITPYLPYLIAGVDNNQDELPEAFLYILTGDYFNDLLLRQKAEYWSASGDRFYDTSLAMWALYYESLEQVDKTKEWLLENQEQDGCWQGVSDTAFILYSTWPKEVSSGTNTNMDCEDAGYFCTIDVNCPGATLDSYECAGSRVCCEEKALQTCSEMGGEFCNDDETCTGNFESDVNGDECCLGGYCKDDSGEQPQKSECELAGGSCYTSCTDQEEQSPEECNYASDVCCMPKGDDGSLLWLWILLIILIILVVLGIVFRDKLQPYWNKIIIKFKKGGEGSPVSNQRGPPRGPPGMPPRQPRPRQILPPSSRPQPRPMPQKKNSGEMDDVLKKLKDMGK